MAVFRRAGSQAFYRDFGACRHALAAGTRA